MMMNFEDKLWMMNNKTVYMFQDDADIRPWWWG